ncbi:MarR family winged helix-turn-helix transcriptional regulator [Salinicola aestuarinus]|uniref:MarR family winged helix-turn-helix transcriptional regulator n=1 Tax=Salinicola aestuarinus TaxID=1949082 RepID=UPI000DA25A3E|nr:MarR family transcriptional regulator [Salinicola aestuarinus]
MPQAPAGETLHHLLHAYRRALRRAYDGQSLALTVAQIRALKSIRALAPTSAREVADYLQRDKAQITRLLRELIETGSVVKQPDPDDGRRQILALSADGQALLSRIDEGERQVHARLAADLDQTDIDAFARLSQRMIHNLD